MIHKIEKVLHYVVEVVEIIIAIITLIAMGPISLIFILNFRLFSFAAY